VIVDKNFRLWNKYDLTKLTYRLNVMDITQIGWGSNLGFGLYALVIDRSCQVLEYIENVDDKNQKQIVSLFNLITSEGLPRNKQKFRDLGDDIFELKTRSGLRALCFTGGPGLRRSLILTHAFDKPHSKILKREKDKALKWYVQYFEETVNIVELDSEV
jgi:phage-related protein